MNIPGGEDATVRVRWISEFQQVGKDIPGSMARARQEYDKAAKDQVKNNRMLLASATDAAKGVQAQQEAERKRLLELRRLSLDEARINKEREKALRDLERQGGRVEQAEERMAAARRKRDAEQAQQIRRTRDIQTERMRLSVIERDIDRANAAAETRKVINARAQERRDASRIAGLRGNTEAERQAAREVIAEIDREREARKNAATDEIIQGDRAHSRRLAQIDRQGRERRERLRKQFADEKADFERGLQEQVDAVARNNVDLEARLKDREDTLKRLEVLRKEFGAETERVLAGPRAPGRGMGRLEPADFSQVDALVKRVQQERQKDVIDYEQKLGRAEKAARNIAQEIRTSGRVSGTAMKDMREAFDNTGLTMRDFAHVTHDAGVQIKNFENAKRTEIKVLNDNIQTAGRHNAIQQRATRIWGELRNGLRLSTNEMILFSRTTRAVVIPATAALIQIIASLITTVVSGGFAMASALSPLAEQLTALPALASSAVQVFAVWKIAMTSLGSTSMTVGRMIQTALTGSTDQFVLSLKNLPHQAQMFAIQMRASLYPGFTKLRNDLQKVLFQGLFDAVRYLRAGQDPTSVWRRNFNSFRGILHNTAVEMANLFRSIAGRASTPLFRADVEKQAQRTNMWIRNLTPAVLNLMDAFRNLALAAGPLVNHMIELVNSFSKWLAIQTALGRVSGDLGDAFKKANSTLDYTISILKDVGTAILNIGKISNRVLGFQMMKDLAGQAKLFKDWTESAKGVSKIETYFKGIKAPLYELGKLVVDLAKAFFQVTDNKDFFNLLTRLRTEVLPELVKMLQTVSKSFAPAMIDLIVSLFKTIAALGEQGGLEGLVKAFTQLSNLIRTIAQSPFAGVIFKLLAGIAVFRTLRFAAAISGLTLLFRILTSVRESMGLTVFQASRLNETLARRGLVAYRPPSFIGPERIGGPVVRPIQATAAGQTYFGQRAGAPPTYTGPGPRFGVFPTGGPPSAQMLFPQGTTVHEQLPSGRMAQIPMTATMAAEEQAIMANMQQRNLRNILSRNAGLIGGAVGAGAITAGAMTGGRLGSVLTGAGTGAMIGAATPFALGAPVGAVVGALAGFALTLGHGKSAAEKFAEAADKAADALLSNKEKLQAAEDDIRQAQLAKEESYRQFQEATRNYYKLRRTPGMAGQIPQARLQVEEAREVYRQSSQRFSKDVSDILRYGPRVQAGKGTVSAEFLREARAVLTETVSPARAAGTGALIGGPRGRAFRQITPGDLAKIKLDDWNKFIDKWMTKHPDDPIGDVVKDLKSISQFKVPSPKTIVIHVKVLGADPFALWILAHDREIRAGTLKVTDYKPPPKKAMGGRIGGPMGAGDVVPALLSPGEFVVTRHGESMLENMTGVPGVLNYVAQNQAPHFARGGRVRRFQAGGLVTPYDFLSESEGVLESAMGGTPFQQIVAAAIDSVTSAMAALDTTTIAARKKKKKKGKDLLDTTPKKLRPILTKMIAQAEYWASQGVKRVPGAGLGSPYFLSTDDYKNGGLDPGAVISDIIRAGAGLGFPDVSPNAYFGLVPKWLQAKPSKYVTVLIRPGAKSEYDAAIKIGKRGFGFSGGKFTTRDIAALTGWFTFHMAGWPMRKGGKVPRMPFGRGRGVQRFQGGGYVGTPFQPNIGVPYPGTKGGGGDDDAPGAPRQRHPGVLHGAALQAVIRELAAKYDLDARALIAVASVTGQFGGRRGWGPFQIPASLVPPAIRQRKNRWWLQTRPGVEYAIQKIAGIAAGQKGPTAIESITRWFQHIPDIEGTAGKAILAYGPSQFSTTPPPIGGGGPTRSAAATAGGGGGGGAKPDPYGLAAQAQQRVALTAFANKIHGASFDFLADLSKNLKSQIEDMSKELLQAQLAGKKKRADQIQLAITKLQAQLDIVSGAIGERLNSITRQIAKITDRITGVQNIAQNQISRLGLDPAGEDALNINQRALDQSVLLARKNLQLAKLRLAHAKKAGLPQSVIDDLQQAVIQAVRDLRDMITEQIVNARNIIRRQFERPEARAQFRETLQELGLQKLELQQRLAGTFETGGPERAAFITEKIIPAIKAQIAALQSDLAHAREQRLTEDEKMAKQIQLAELGNKLLQAQLDAQELANSILQKTLGKLTFEFSGQTWSDMLKSGVGV